MATLFDEIIAKHDKLGMPGRRVWKLEQEMKKALAFCYCFQ